MAHQRPRFSALFRPLVLVFSLAALVFGQRVPHNQDKPPGPPLSPGEALEKFELPPGFHLELVASEPDIVNPIKMCFDSRGRIWLVESVEYPRRSEGGGRDRIKILEDTDADGRADRFRIFADGLNIPCGIALGYGGVFVTNSPDVLFLEDVDGDDRADRRTVLFTGFGRHDTHELPNTLTWGPDGWLYGLNGVFNPAHIRYRGSDYRFTCALWRYHPRTGHFEVFAEGTSNPWGVGFDREGAAFVEACVIDHLFHLTETGYYHRQAGQYPPFTWKIESIVKHRNYKAAYCGLDFYDAEAYPEEYRNLVYYGNIHGNCINADRLRRDGSTYFASRGPIILKTEDVWFMPVDIRLGPDGCFYVLDWYDRYHCYQDARRDPEGIDRLKGRLWRIAYGDVKRPGPFDLAAASGQALIDRLGAANRWWRDASRRILAERRDAATYAPLKALVLDPAAPRVQRLQALWTLVGADGVDSVPQVLDPAFHRSVLALEDSGLRAWGVRAAGTLGQVDDTVRRRVVELARDASPDVRLQVAIAARKLLGPDALPLVGEVLVRSSTDPLIPKIAWRNLEPLLESGGPQLVRWLESRAVDELVRLEPISGRIVDRLLARQVKDEDTVVDLVSLLLRDPDRHREAAAQCLWALSRSVTNGEMEASTLARLRPGLSPVVSELARKSRADPLYMPAMAIAVGWGEPAALEACRTVLRDSGEKTAVRSQAMHALLTHKDASILEVAAEVFGARTGAPESFVLELLSGLGRLESPAVATVVLEHLDSLSPRVLPQALDLLCQRPVWARALVEALAAGRLAARQLNVTQVRRLLALDDEVVTERVTETWGRLREERDPAREQVIARMRQALERGSADPWKGKAVYEKVCAQCHVLFGTGSDVGPDITVNGRETLDLLLSNLLDPNLVIGKDYYARTVVTRTGRALTGLLLEESPQRVVLKVAGGKQEVVPRREVLEVSVSPVSLMPEDLERTVTEEEFRDLIAFLRYNEPPPEPVETRIAPGTALERSRLAVEQRYGLVRVTARFPGAEAFSEVLSVQHSSDRRPFIHPLHAPAGGPVLTGLAPEGDSVQHGVFTGHPRVNSIDFWSGEGWIRSRGLRSVVQENDRVEIIAVSDWLTRRRGGERILAEEQTMTVYAPLSEDRYRVDVVWKLTADVDVTFRRHDDGGLAFRAAAHDRARRLEASSSERRAWQGVSGRFAGTEAGMAIFDHPDNPGFPSGWGADRRGLMHTAITRFGAIAVDAGETLTFRFRLLVYSGRGDREMVDAEYRRWAPQGSELDGGEER